MPAIAVGTAKIAAHAASRRVSSFCDTEISERLRFERGPQEVAQAVDHLVDTERVVVDVAEIEADSAGIK